MATVVGMIANGMTEAEILQTYPDLEPDDLREALRYDAEAVARTRIAARENRLRFLVDNALS